MGLVIDAAAYSYIGGRKNNEDNFYLNGVYMERGRMDEGGQCEAVFSGDSQIYAVCDGMGGALYGEEASLLAVSELRRYQAGGVGYDDPVMLKQLLRRISDGINHVSISHGLHEGASGSTIAMLVINGGGFRTVNIGDSRIYRLRRDAFERLTKDHSLVQQLLDMGRITPDAAFRHPMKNVITQHLGMSGEAQGIEPTISPYMELQPGDRYLICSDGVSDMVTDEEIGRIIEANDTPISSAKTLVRESLCGAREMNVTADNITLIRLDVLEAGGNANRRRHNGARIFGRRVGRRR